MSINVTVTGNPVSIKRGKMVTACRCNEPQQDEFERRRLMRLEQVRQQSKEIAESVRNKVRREKQKQCCAFERESERKLKDWQARKLLELHNQYQENLQNIGLGHREAEIIDIIEEDIETERECCPRGRHSVRCSSAPGRQRGNYDTLRASTVSHCSKYNQPKPSFYTVLESTPPAGCPSPIQVSARTGSTSSVGQYARIRRFSPPKTVDGSGSNIDRNVGEPVPSTSTRVDEDSNVKVGNRGLNKTAKGGKGTFESQNAIGTSKQPPRERQTAKVRQKSASRLQKNKTAATEDYTHTEGVGSSRSYVDREQNFPEESRVSQGVQKKSAGVQKDRSMGEGGREVGSQININKRVTEEPVVSQSRQRQASRTSQSSRKGPTVDEDRPKESAQDKLGGMDSQERPRRAPPAPQNRPKPISEEEGEDDSVMEESDGFVQERAAVTGRGMEETSDGLVKGKQKEVGVSSAQKRRNAEETGEGFEETGGGKGGDSPQVAGGSDMEDREKMAEGRTRKGSSRTDRDADVITVQETSEKYTKRDLLTEGQSSPQRLLEKTTRTSKTIQYPVETRISDRIRHRSSMTTTPDFCDASPDEQVASARPTIRSNPNLPKPTTSSRSAKPQKVHSATLDTIPEKPVVVLKDAVEGKQMGSATSCTRATCPDYQREALKFLQSKKRNVERIAEERLEVVTDYDSEDELMKKVERQDREAEERGRQAMQKEKTRKDYEDLMKKLPVVQRQEGLNRIRSSISDHHMSEERLKEMEERRQFQMESAFESAFPNLKPNIITAPSAQDDVGEEPFRVASVTQKKDGVGVGARDASKTAETAEDDCCECCPSGQTKREKELRELLSNLQTQKELLLKEVDSLPKDSKLDEILGSLHDMSAKKTKKTKKTTASTKKRSLTESSRSSVSSSSSPRKKKKTKSCRCVLIRQNTSTQTSPVSKTDAQVGDSGIGEVETSTSPRQPEVVSQATSPQPPHVCAISGEICECGTDPKAPCRETRTDVEEVCKTSGLACECGDDKVCEIVIKIRENETQPEIIVNPAEKGNVDVVGVTESMAKKPQENKSVEANTWRQQLSQNSMATSTPTSTSYYSPPEAAEQNSKRKRTESRQPRLKDALQDKQKQTNLASSSTATTAPCRKTQTMRKLHPFITKYIDKLLSMSKTSIDDLSVSSVSDVATPCSSITDLDSNVSLVHLRKLLKRLGVTYDELREMYGKSEKHEKVLNSLPSSSSSGSMSSAMDLLQHKVDSNCCCVTQDECTNTFLSAKLSLGDVSDEDDEKYRERMMQYAQIAESCNKKISNLTAMIEKVRSEKDQIMNNTDETPKDQTTTAYYDPPQGETASNSSSVEQEWLDHMLLAIDPNISENLKHMSAGQIRKHYGYAPVEHLDDVSENSIADIRRRYRQLISVDAAPPQRNQEQTFEPLLKDIPKLPLFCESPKCPKRPPPSKGLAVAKRYNEEITGLPHELSTILEGDSQVSTKLPKSHEEFPQSPKSTDTSTPDILREITANFRQGTRTPADASKKQAAPNGTVQKQTKNSSSSEDMESLENMLREMGMGWAIVTLRKTQEALALTSSSSSLDINIQQKGAHPGESSEISLRGVLSRHLLTKISTTSTSSSETSISLLMKEFEDISAILGSGSTAREGQRTSTPVHVASNRMKACCCKEHSSSGSERNNKRQCAHCRDSAQR